MRKNKKIFTTVLAVIVIAAMSLSTLTALEISLYNDSENTTPLFYFYEGTVKEINKIDDRTLYSIEKDGEIIANIVVTDSTCVEGGEIKKGDSIKAFYDANAPMLMIYPPQVTAVVVTVNLPEIQSVKVDKFDENLLSSDGELKLNVSEETEIIWQDGSKFDGELANKNLAVIYSITTRSIPAQTPPIKVIVLFDKETPVAEHIYLNGEITVEGKKIEAPKPYTDENGVVMVPLRAVAEALGYKVTWDGKDKSVMLNNVIGLTIGKDYYTYARTAPIELGAAPVLKDSYTYVPIDFFTDVMRIPNVRIDNGQVKISTDESTLTITIE